MYPGVVAIAFVTQDITYDLFSRVLCQKVCRTNCAKYEQIVCRTFSCICSIWIRSFSAVAFRFLGSIILAMMYDSGPFAVRT